MSGAREGNLPISTHCHSQEVKEGAESAEGREDSHKTSELIHKNDNRMQRYYMKDREGRHRQLETKSAWIFSLFHLLVGLSYDIMKLSSCVFPLLPACREPGWAAYISESTHRGKAQAWMLILQGIPRERRKKNCNGVSGF